jgi:hypothetical protein
MYEGIKISLYTTLFGLVLLTTACIFSIISYSLQLNIKPDDGSIISSYLGYTMLLSVILMFEGFKHICIILIMYVISYIISISLTYLYYMGVYIKMLISIWEKDVIEIQIMHPEDMV